MERVTPSAVITLQPSPDSKSSRVRGWAHAGAARTRTSERIRANGLGRRYTRVLGLVGGLDGGGSVKAFMGWRRGTSTGREGSEFYDGRRGMIGGGRCGGGRLGAGWWPWP